MKISKGKNQNFKVARSDLSTMQLSVPTLDIFCKYVIASPSLVKISHIASLSTMIESIDPSTYNTDPDKINRINFIRRGIEARLKYNLTDKSLILNHIISGLSFTPDFIDLKNELTVKEVEWCNAMIEESVKFQFVYPMADQFIDLATQIKTTDFDHRRNTIKNFENLIDTTKNEFRKATINDNLVDMEFSLKNGEFENCIREIYDVVTSPSRRLICGMQGLNAMTGGGFEATRVYMLLGVTGVGKSVTLLNLAYQIKRYNANYKLKDPSKIPCVTYLTMENSVVETVVRLFDMTTDSQFGMGSYSLDEVIRKFREEGQLKITENSPIALVIRYKPNRSVDTSYLYDLYDDLEDEGYEPICFIQDHLLRIRSVEKNSEPRFELGNIVNEFKTFATEKEIPVISNFHLNRDAMKAVEDYRNKATKIDVTQKLGKSNVSESVMILNNSDCSIIINKEYDEQGQAYMGFNLVKMRDKTNVFYFAQPFAYGGEIKLIEDVNGPAMFKQSIHGGNTNHNNPNNRSSASAMASINNITQANQSYNSSFNQNDSSYSNLINDIMDEPDMDQPIISKPVAVDPFIRNLPKENPNDVIRNKIDGLKELRAKIG